MVRHIVFWRVADAPRGRLENAREIKRLLEALQGQIPGLLHVEVGLNFLDDAAASDCALFSEFADRAALANYQTHPAHEAVKATIRGITTERRVVDYDC